MTSSCKGTASPGLVHSIHSLHVLLTWYTALMVNYQSTHANARCCQSQGILLACCWHDPLHYNQTLSVLWRSCQTLGCPLQRTHATITQTLRTGIGHLISNISLFMDTWLLCSKQWFTVHDLCYFNFGAAMFNVKKSVGCLSTKSLWNKPHGNKDTIGLWKPQTL